MRVINVIEVVENNVAGIHSFCVFEEQLSQEVVDKAKEHFLKLVEEFIGEPLSDEPATKTLINMLHSSRSMLNRLKQ